MGKMPKAANGDPKVSCTAMVRRCCKGLFLIPLVFVGGCLTTGPTNPSFAVTTDEARKMLREMSDHPRRLERPLLIISNYMDGGRHAANLKHVFHDCTGDRRIITVVTGFPRTLEECRAKAIEAVETTYSSSDPDGTAEVDVIGVSLGGLTARFAAAPSEDGASGRRLRVARMFTIASPHCGAVIAKNYLGRSQQLWRDLRPGSQFLAYLAREDPKAKYTLYPYTRLHDAIVGEANAAPPGQTPIWVPSLPFKEGHDDAWEDSRILADIARRLRGETPLAGPKREPLPQ